MARCSKFQKQKNKNKTSKLNLNFKENTKHIFSFLCVQGVDMFNHQDVDRLVSFGASVGLSHRQYPYPVSNIWPLEGYWANPRKVLWRAFPRFTFEFRQQTSKPLYTLLDG